jgi:centrosomal protein CEP290
MNKHLEEGLDKYRRKLNVIKHQTGLLYKDFHEKQQQWINERDQTTEIKRDLQTEVEKNIVKLQEFDVKFFKIRFKRKNILLFLASS